MNLAGKFGCVIFFAAAFASAQMQQEGTAARAVSVTAEHHRLIEILADKDSRFKIGGSDHASLVLAAGETIRLKITAVRAKEADREGSVHGLVLLDKNGNKVPGWNLQLKPGTREVELVAPATPGDYVAVCNVICSTDHERMRLKVKVLASTESARSN